jgi:predicted RND superfamily exporter protein
MAAKLTQGFWLKVARIILRNRILILALIAAVTVFLAMQWQHMRFSTSEANLLPDDHPVNLKYNEFLSIFGEEGNAIILGVKDSSLFTPEKFNRWNILSKKLDAFPEVDFVVSTDNLQILEKDNDKQEFVLLPFLQGEVNSKEEIDSLTNRLFNELPFYDKVLYNKETGTIRTVVYLDQDIVNTSVRKDFVLNELTGLVEDFEEETQLDVRVSGMPYIRTLNSQNIIDEIGSLLGPPC